VHGGLHKEGIVITKDHTEGLEEMDKLSDFAPLHVSRMVKLPSQWVAADCQNHHAVLAVKACLDALPNHTSLLLFDTLFHVSPSAIDKLSVLVIIR
jgi:acetate kinase